MEELLAELDGLVGLVDVKADVRRLTSLLRIQRLRAERGLPTLETSHHLVFTGNPGTGKTTVARLLSQILRALGIVSKGHLVETDRSHLVAGYVGQTAARTRTVMESALGGTLLIDEAYALARGGEQDFGREAIDTIVKFMEDHRDDLAVIAAGYPEEMQRLIEANPGLESRFARTIHFPDYTTEELVAIFETMSEQHEYHLDEAGALQLAAVIHAEPRGRGFRQCQVRAQRVRGCGRPPGRAAGVDRHADRRAVHHAHGGRHRRAMIPTPDDIERAWERIRDHVRVTPVVSLEAGELGLPAPAVLKLELLQHTGSFKPRGAFHSGVLTGRHPRPPACRRVGRQPWRRRRLCGATTRPACRGLRPLDQPADEARPDRRARC